MQTCTDAPTALVVTVKNWIPAREGYRQFLAAHPELGLKFTEATFKAFSSRFGPALAEAGVLRKAGLRSPAIVDVTRFDEVAFDLMSRNPLKADGELLAFNHK